MKPSDDELGRALQMIAEQMNRIEGDLVHLKAELLAVKSELARAAEPSNPAEVLLRIEEFVRQECERDPTRENRAAIDQLAHLIRMIEKHGGGSGQA